jgi:outer membrane protein assembly factor BamB
MCSKWLQILPTLFIIGLGCSGLKIDNYPQDLDPLNQNFLTAQVNYHRNSVTDQEIDPPLVLNWKRDYLFFPERGLTAAEKIFYFGTGNGYLAAARVRDGKLVGKKNLGEACAVPPTIYAGILYQSFENGKTGLVAYDLRQGKVLWQLPKNLSKSSPLVKDRKVFFLNINGLMQCYNFLTGDLIWNRKIDTQALNSPALDENYLITTGLNGKVAALEYTSGVVVWEKSVRDAILADPVINAGCVYLVTYRGKFYIFNLKNGNAIDSLHFDIPVYYAPVIDQTMIFVPLSDGQLVAIDRQSLEINWKFQADGPWAASPLVTKKYIYATGLDEKFYILIKKSGTLAQEIPLSGRARSTPVIIDDKILLTCENTTVLAYGHEDK